MNQVKKTLSRFGLTNNEILIYVEALKQGEASPFKLSQLTKVPRTTVYDVLTSLSLKGLIEMTQSDGLQKQQTKIRAKNPSELRKIIQTRKEQLTSLETDVLEILPQLKGDYHQDEPNADFKFYPGIKGATKVFFEEDKDQVDLPVYCWTHLMPMDVFGSIKMNQNVLKETKFRLQAKTKVKEIIPLNNWTKHVISYQDGQDSNYLDAREVRYLDNPIFKQYARLAIKGTRVRITCAHNDEVWGLIINSQALSKSLQSIFELTWQMSTPLTKKMIKSWDENEFLKQEKKK
ncbi:MAG: helix-turn-helix domain-containing protein [Candidatus Beckwithbacteria bacterium]|nr:hypothetical protein [Patescibacteria group bacterium]